MLLQNLNLRGTNGLFNIGINGGHISSVTTNIITENDDISLYFENALAFPGLINSHDHLEFNLFGKMGTKSYSNYVEWGNDIHQKYKAEIDKVLKVPEVLRVQWGIYKNLLGGVTTVLHHGKHYNLENALVNVFNKCQNLHSVQLEKKWKLRLNNPLKISIPTVIHIGEGVDKIAAEEINDLLKWNLFGRDLVGIHGVNMNSLQAKSFKALVWCPQSNYFLLNFTAEIEQLKKHTSILFGTDSTLSADWDIWEHIRDARAIGLLNDDELYASLNTTPSRVWNLNSGSIEEKKQADVVVAKMSSNDTEDSFFKTKPEDILLIVQRGNIRLFDESLISQLDESYQKNYSSILLNGIRKYVAGDLPGLANEIKRHYPEAVFPFGTE